MTRFIPIILLACFGIQFNVSAQQIQDKDIIGIWIHVKEESSSQEYADRINESLRSGNYIDTLDFKANKTYVRSSGMDFISTGNWSVIGDRIQTKNSRFEPLQKDGRLYPLMIFDKIELIGDTLKMQSQSEIQGWSYYKKLKK